MNKLSSHKDQRFFNEQSEEIQLMGDTIAPPDELSYAREPINFFATSQMFQMPQRGRAVQPYGQSKQQRFNSQPQRNLNDHEALSMRLELRRRLINNAFKEYSLQVRSQIGLLMIGDQQLMYLENSKFFEILNIQKGQAQRASANFKKVEKARTVSVDSDKVDILNLGKSQDIFNSDDELKMEDSVTFSTGAIDKKLYHYQSRRDNKVYFKMVQERNKRWCVKCNGLKIVNKEFAEDLKADGTVDLNEVEERRLQRARNSRINPRDFTMEKFRISESSGFNCLEWWDGIESSLPEFLRIVRGIRVCCSSKKKASKKKKPKFSYRDLMRHITTYHPIDPDTNDKFSVHQNVTVPNFLASLIDCCYCSVCYNCCRRCIRDCIRCYTCGDTPKKRAYVKKPESMADVPDSDSSEGGSEVDDPYRGLENSAIFLGEGPVLYLQILKTILYMFIFLCLINLPCFLALPRMSNNNQWSDLEALGRYLSLGNIGYLNQRCSHGQFSFGENSNTFDLYKEFVGESKAQNKLSEGALPRYMLAKNALPDGPGDISLTCPGSEEYIMRLDVIGLTQSWSPKDSQLTQANELCEAINDPLDYKVGGRTEEQQRVYKEYVTSIEFEQAETDFGQDDLCQLDSSLLSTNTGIVQSQLDQLCANQTDCTFNLQSPMFGQDEDKSIEDLLSSECLSRIYSEQVSTPELLVAYTCNWDEVMFNGYRVHKVDGMLVAVILDILSILIMYVLLQRLQTINQQYLEILGNNIVKMSNFTIEIRGIRLDRTVQDPRMLKMKLWMHFSRVLRKCNEEKNIEAPSAEDLGSSFSSEEIDAPRISIDSKDDFDEDFEENLKAKSRKVTVADIQFSRQTTEQELLLELQGYRAKINNCTKEMEKSTTNPQKAMFYQEKMGHLEKYDKVKIEYEQEVLQNQVRKAGQKIKKKDFIEDISYVWITFTDNDIAQKIQKLFQKESQGKKLCRFLCCQRSRVREVTSFADQELDVCPTVEPDQIIWPNLKYTFAQQNNFFCILILASIVMAVVTYYVTVILMALEDVTEPMDCSRFDEISAEQAYKSQEIELERLKLIEGEVPEHYALTDWMACYCQRLTVGGFALWRAYDTAAFQRYAQPDIEIDKFCVKSVVRNLNTQLVIQASDFIPAVLDTLIAICFGYLGSKAMLHNTVSQQVNAFVFILILETFNKGIVLLLKSLDPTGSARIIEQAIAGELENTSLFSEEDIAQAKEGFTFQWYDQHGSNLVNVILLSTLLSNYDEINVYLSSLFSRWYDRGFSVSVKKDLEDSDDDEPITQAENQEQLQELYTGEEFAGDLAISRLGSTTVICLMFGPGMPVMYLNGFLFFLLSFFVGKTLLFHYYQKSTSLDRVVPQTVIPFFYAAIVAHMVLGVFVFINQSLVTFNETSKGTDYKWLDFLLPDQYKTGWQFYQKAYVVFCLVFVSVELGRRFGLGIAFFLYNRISELVAMILSQIYNALQGCYVRIFGKESSHSRRSRLAEIEAHRKNSARQDKQTIDLRSNIEGQNDMQIDLRNLEGGQHQDPEVMNDENEQNEGGDKPDFQKPKSKLLQTISNKVENMYLNNIQKLRAKQKLTLGKPVSQQLLQDNQIVGHLKTEENELLREENAKVLIQKIYEPIDQPDDRLKPKNEQKRSTKQERQNQDQEARIFWRTLIKYPYKSFNVYKDLSIPNLIKCYKRAKRDLNDYLLYFGIRDKVTAQKILLAKPPGYDEAVIRLDGEEPDKNELRINFEELCYEAKISYSEVHEYITMLLRRIKMIEQSIDDHFVMLSERIRAARTAVIVKNANESIQKQTADSGNTSTANKSVAGGTSSRNVKQSSRSAMRSSRGGSGLSKRSNFSTKSKKGFNEEQVKLVRELVAKEVKVDKQLRFFEFTYDEKLQKLLELSMQLSQEDRERKQNRRNMPTICRMTSNINQSYFLLDQVQYDLAHEIYYKGVKQQVNQEAEELKKFIMDEEQDETDLDAQRGNSKAKNLIDKAIQLKKHDRLEPPLSATKKNLDKYAIGDEIKEEEEEYQIEESPLRTPTNNK